MSYLSPSGVSQARAPSVNDDQAAGFVVGSSFTDTSVSPNVTYYCLDDAVSAAVWRRGGGVTVHSGLTGNLWTTALHDGTPNGVAAFNPSNVAAVYQPVSNGSVFTLNAGAFQWTSPPQPTIVISARSNDVVFLPFAVVTGASQSAKTGQVYVTATSSQVLGGSQSVQTGAFV